MTTSGKSIHAEEGAICVSVHSTSLAALESALDGIALAEVRLDLCDLSAGDVRRVFAREARLVATCRPGRFEAAEREARLRAAIEAGAAYVDLELDGDHEERRRLSELASSRGCRIIVSHHDFDATPPRDALDGILDRCFEAGADVAKIACHARCAADAGRLLGLYGDGRPVIAIGMGPFGKITRIAAPFLGAPFTFASSVDGGETAPGQIPRRALQALFEEMERA